MNITGSRRSTKRIVFIPAEREGVTFGGDWFRIGDGDPSNGPDHLTIRGFVGAEGASPQVPDNRHGIHVAAGSSHIRLENVRAGSVIIQASTDIDVRSSELGPCRASMVIGGGTDGNGVLDTRHCEINKVDHAAAAGITPQRITFDNVLFQGYDLSPSCFSMEQGGTNTVWPDCHWRSFYANGVHGLTIRNSTFRDGAFAPWVVVVGDDARRVGNKNILIENNFFGTGVNYGTGIGRYDTRGYGRWESFDFARCDLVAPGVYAFDKVVYRFNSASTGAGFQLDSSCTTASARDIHVYGNIGTRNGCSPASIVTYRYNVYTNSGTCHASERNILPSGASSLYTNARDAPGPLDYRLTGRRTAADDVVPLKFGCPATDKFGKRRGTTGFCDAGAHER